MAEEMSWDLTAYYPDFSSPEIENDLKEIKSELEQLKKEASRKFRRKSLRPGIIAEILNKYENLAQKAFDLQMYSILSISTDTKDKSALQLYSKVQRYMTKIEQEKIQIEAELGKLLQKKDKILLSSDELYEKKHFLEKLVLKFKYMLPENEEEIIVEKNQVGAKEWSQLQARWLASRKFTVDVQSEKKEASWSSGFSLMNHPVYEVRKDAIKVLLGGLGEDQELYATCLRNICANYVYETKKRGYSSFIQQSALENDLSQEIIENMLKEVRENIDMFQEFLDIKAQIFGTKKLRGEDYEAPFPFQDNTEITWDDAKSLVNEIYKDFDEEFGQFAKILFENNRIDSKPRTSKRSGAFTVFWYEGKSAFSLLSFNNNLENTRTLTHEIGHAIHSHITASSQSYFNFYPTIVLAETASEFGTMLFIDKMKNKTQDKEKIKGLYFKTLEIILNQVFEVASRTFFEQALYEAIENKVLLNAEKINEIFWESRKQIFGDKIDWMPEQVYQWCWKPHYYHIEARFYNYPYVFSELLVLVLYAIYKKDKAKFLPNYKRFLKAGTSKSPQQLVEIFNLDLSSQEIWKLGMNELRRLLDEVKNLL